MIREEWFGGGECGALVRNHDWSKTSLGPIDTWSPLLKSMVGVVLSSKVGMVLCWGSDLVMIYNDGYGQFAGGRHPQALGGRVETIWPEAWDSWNKAVFEQAFAGQAQVYRDQHLILERNAAPEDVWIDLFYTPVRGDSKEVLGVLCTVIETTDAVLTEQRRQEAEAALKQANLTLQLEREAVKEANRRLTQETHFLRGLFEQAPGFMTVLRGPDHIFELFNPPYLQLVGHRDILGKPVREALPEVVEQGFIDLLDKVYRTGKPFVGKQVPLRVQNHPNGALEERLVDFVYQPIRSPDGSISGIFVEGMDVTERWAAEERLHIAQKAGGIGTFEWHTESDVLVVSDTFRSIWGLPQDIDVTLEVLLGVIHPEDFPILGTKNFDSNYAPIEYIEYRIIRPDTGAVRWIARQGEIVSSRTQQQRRFVGVVYDITDRKTIEAELRLLNENLEHRVATEVIERSKAEEALRQAQKMEALGQLTGGVAHDFNNVLQIIAGNLQLLQLTVSGNQQAEGRLQTAAGAVQRGAKLASQLLAFARRTPLNPSVTHLGRLLRNMDDLLRRALGEEIEIETIVGGGLWNTLVDPSQLENVVLNLAINARDAMNRSGKLTIELGNAMLDDLYVQGHEEVSPGQYVLLAISDTGCGMPPDIIAKAFDPFFTTKPEGEGTGLGLSMAYGVVKQSHGHIKIYSEVGIGTTIKIYLPRSFEPEEITEDPLSKPAVGGTETILVVEDDVSVQATVVDMLTSLGYTVLKADNGQNALPILKSGMKIDVLFTDVVMPGPLRSPELAKQAKLLQPEIAVLFTSGYTQNAIVHGGRLDAGVELLSKPYRREELARKIRHVLANSQQAQQGKQALVQMRKEGRTMPTGPLRILVVEDNPDALESVSLLLEISGYEVQRALSAEDALHHLNERDCDVLFTDVSLPGMSGIALAQEARRSWPHMDIIFASGYGDDVGEELGFPSRSVAKPYDFQKLQELFSKISSARSRAAKP